MGNTTYEFTSQIDIAKNAIKPTLDSVVEIYEEETGRSITIHEKPSKFILKTKRRKLAVIEVNEFLNDYNRPRKKLIIKAKHESFNSYAEELYLRCKYSPTKLILKPSHPM